jgi:hypothetical protein
MAVKNPAKQGGRLTPYSPNQEPTTKRGKRRSEKTEEYKTNLERRKKQSHPGG